MASLMSTRKKDQKALMCAVNTLEGLNSSQKKSWSSYMNLMQRSARTKVLAMDRGASSSSSTESSLGYQECCNCGLKRLPEPLATSLLQICCHHELRTCGYEVDMNLLLQFHCCTLHDINFIAPHIAAVYNMPYYGRLTV